ncbi:MAG: class I SAM-dependent methyltransferase [Clostridia bacterium]|nr:class I SAM-dependent methyltransferase [Clostridia bacterium]
MINLPPRLLTVYNALDKLKTMNGRVIDVGSDHALFAIYCLQNNITPFAIATDINRQPAERSYNALIEAGFMANSTVYNTDGIRGVYIRENDSIVIAGMGGNNIIDIMTYALESIEPEILGTVDFIIQPQKSLDKVREFLSNKGFELVDEIVSYDNENYYVIMKVRFTGVSYDLSDEAVYYGMLLLNKDDELTLAYHKHLDEVFVLRSRGDSRLYEVMKNRGLVE